jgi:DNA polymerase V
VVNITGSASTYIMRVPEKLRDQGSQCKKLRFSIRTGMFNPEEAKYATGVVVGLSYPTDDVRLLTKAAIEALDQVFRPGSKYSKVEVMLLKLCQPGE